MRLFNVSIRHEINGLMVVSRCELMAQSGTDAVLWMLEQIKPMRFCAAGARPA